MFMAFPAFSRNSGNLNKRQCGSTLREGPSLLWVIRNYHNLLEVNGSISQKCINVIVPSLKIIA